MQTIIDLEKFLEHLKLQGIHIGTLELQRLQTIFATKPELSRSDLLSVLQATIAKNESQRKIITYSFNYLLSNDNEISLSLKNNVKEEIEGKNVIGHAYKNENISPQKAKAAHKKIIITSLFY